MRRGFSTFGVTGNLSASRRRGLNEAMQLISTTQVSFYNSVFEHIFAVRNAKIVFDNASIKTSRAVAKTWLIFLYFIAANAEARQFSEIQDPGTSGIVSVLFLLPFSFMILRIGFLRKNETGILRLIDDGEINTSCQ